MKKIAFLLLLVFCVSGFSQTGTLTDEFDDTISTALSDHTADSGHSWTYNGTPTLTILGCVGGWGDCSDEGLSISGGSVHNRFAYTDLGYADFDLNCKTIISNGSGTTLIGFAFRFSSSNNYVLSYIQLNSSTYTVLVREVDAGTLQSPLALSTDGINACGTGCDYRVLAVGSSIKIYIDDDLKLDVTSTWNQTETKAGPYGWYSVGTAQYEDLNISEVSSVSSLSNVRRRGRRR